MNIPIVNLGSVPARASSGVTMTVPEQVGRYRIEREIGRGGMAIVYLASDPTMNRQVAVKILPRHFSFELSFQERFRREVEIIAGLEHPSIVPVYDYGVYDQLPFLVMRFMSGGSLGSKLEKGALSPEQANGIVRPIAAALDKAHRRNIIHRDVKPDNVLFDEDGQPYLSDFGVARLIEGTQTMTIVGTPSYMSPEQAQGDGQIDGRSDIYALGVMLFEMLSGQSPYQADTPVKLMMMHVMEPIPDICSVNPSVSPEFQSVIDRAMAKDPSDRFSTATEMANAISAIVAGGTMLNAAPLAATVLDSAPIMPPPIPPRGGPPEPVSDKRPFPKALAAIMAILLLLLVVSGIWLISDRNADETEQAESTIEPTEVEESQNGTPVPGSGGADPDLQGAAATQTANARIIANQNATITARADELQETPSPTIELPTDTPTHTPTPSITPTATPTPLFIVDLTNYADIRASDSAPPGQDTSGATITYEPSNLTDGQENTAWRVEGDGRDDFIRFDFPNEIALTAVDILPGYNKTDPFEGYNWCLYNHIPSQIMLTTSEGTSLVLDLFNDCEWQHFEFDPLQTSYVKLTILNSYPRREDHPSERTAISEIQLHGGR